MGKAGSKSVSPIKLSAPTPSELELPPPPVPSNGNVPIPYNEIPLPNPIVPTRQCFYALHNIIDNPLKSHSSLCWMLTRDQLDPSTDCLQQCKDDPNCRGFLNISQAGIRYNQVRSDFESEVDFKDLSQQKNFLENSLINGKPIGNFEVPCPCKHLKIGATLS